MTRALPLSGEERFWPPADELTEAAERIRARLGDWPPSHVAWRICLAAPDEPNGGDLIVVADGSHDTARIARWLSRGAGVIEAADGRATLRLAGNTWRLEGPLADDWTAALAAFLDCGFDPQDALVLALAWRDGDERTRDDAWPSDLARFPRVAGLPAAPAVPFAPCPEKLGLYPVLPDAAWVEKVLDCGVKTVQLRAKNLTAAQVSAEITRAVDAGRRHNAQLFINDHWRAALDAGAYGVHLGQEDLQLPGLDLTAIAAAGVRLGLSTHGYYEMLVALHFRPSYIAFGAIFATSTKLVETAPQGLARLERYVRLLDGVVPLVAIGGISADRLASVVATGVGSAAVVSAVTSATQPSEAISALQRTFLQ